MSVLLEFGRVTKAGCIRLENVASQLHKTSRDIVQRMSAKQPNFALARASQIRSEQQLRQPETRYLTKNMAAKLAARVL